MLKGPYKEFAKIVVVTVFIAIIGTFIIAFISYLQKQELVKADDLKLKKLYVDILEGEDTGSIELSVDYVKPISNGSPLIFGGSHAPDINHQEIWDKIKDAGVTSIRKDFFPENILPRDISLEDYKNNKNNIQDQKNWKQNELNKINDIYKNAHKRGLKTIGIASYSPAWLNHSNTIYGVPKDWAVYKDIIKKTYSIYRDNLDYVEIWNEPSFNIFLDLKGSNLSREEAYKMIFKTATEAIREVDKEKNDGRRIKIGGPVSHTPFETSVLEIILQDPVLLKELDFISYHNYESDHLAEPSDIHFRSVMKKYNANNLPIFITEWSYAGGPDNPHPYNTSNQAIYYTGIKFINFLKMGLQGANYHVLEPLDENLPNFGEGTNGFYRWRNGSGELLPQAKTWRLLSKQMGLGNGESKIFSVDRMEESNIELNSIGFVNSEGQLGTVFVNDTTDAQPVQITLNNTNIGSYAKVQIYKASIDNDAKEPIYEGLMKIDKNNQISFKYYIPEESVIGIKMTGEREWYENLPLPFDN